MDNLKSDLFIITTVSPNTHKKTIELSREVSDSFTNNSNRYYFTSIQSNVHFLNLALTRIGYPPKIFNEETVNKINNIFGNNFPQITRDICLFMNLNVIPLSKKAIENIIEFTKRSGITIVSADCFCFSLKTYLEAGSPMLEELFDSPFRNMALIDQLKEISFDLSNNKSYGKHDEKMFYVANLQNKNWEQDYWSKCESILVDGIYEDRSIKH